MNNNNIQRPLVSIIICTYNGEEFLKQSLESVFSQTYKKFEIIAVDDGSADSTQDILNAAEQKDDRLKVFFQENKGLANARNFAFHKATGEWIALVDQDDLCYSDRIETLVKNTKNDSADLIFSNVDYVDSLGRTIGNHLSNFSGFDNFIKKNTAGNLLLRYGCFVPSCGVFFRKKLVKKIGLLDESFSYACDYEYFIRMGFASAFLKIDKSLSAWRIHPGQATKTNTHTKKNLESIKIYMKFLFDRNLFTATRLHLLKSIIRLQLSNLKSFLKNIFNLT